ncbi:MAG: NUDIX hydrolase [Nonomuraea sp.]|nr:NUDIX hydrolase [Nonomuraea sp.]
MPPSADGTVAPDESFEEAAVREPAEETGHPRHRPHHGNRRHPRPPDRCRTGGSGSDPDTMSRRRLSYRASQFHSWRWFPRTSYPPTVPRDRPDPASHRRPAPEPPTLPASSPNRSWTDREGDHASDPPLKLPKISTGADPFRMSSGTSTSDPGNRARIAFLPILRLI